MRLLLLSLFRNLRGEMLQAVHANRRHFHVHAACTRSQHAELLAHPRSSVSMIGLTLFAPAAAAALSSLRLVTLDLDDTLWPTGPVVRAANAKVAAAVGASADELQARLKAARSGGGAKPSYSEARVIAIDSWLSERDGVEAGGRRDEAEDLFSLWLEPTLCACLAILRCASVRSSNSATTTTRARSTSPSLRSSSGTLARERRRRNSPKSIRHCRGT